MSINRKRTRDQAFSEDFTDIDGQENNQLGINVDLPSSMWSRSGGARKSRTVREYMPRVDSLRRYGPTAAAAYTKGGAEWDNRLADMYLGAGRYKRGARRTKRRTPRYRGRGLYSGTGGFWGDKWNEWKGRLGGGFKAAANAMGFAPVANALTGIETAGKALGMGEYDVNNGIVDAGAGIPVPTFTDVTDTSVTISHREYISDLFGPPAAGLFQNTVYSINPGLERTFPWLSQIAANYEEYTLKQCIFTYRTTVTDFVSTGGQVGTVIMASQYNPSDTPFQSKQDAMEYDQAMSGKVSVNMLHGVECNPVMNSGSSGKYIRSGPPRESDDLKQYDWANLNLAVCNIPAAFANQALGEIWVSYTVELRKPKFFVSRGLNILRDTFVGNDPTIPGPDIATMLTNDDYAYGQQNRIGGDIVNVSAGLPTQGALPPGHIRYVFPATFSGSVVVRLTAHSANVPAFSCYLTIAAQTVGGSIKLLNDMFIGSTWQSSIATTNANPGSSAMAEMHLTVMTPTSAGSVLDNYIDIGVLSIIGIPLNMNSFHLDVSMYNTGFNYPSSSNIMVVNPVTLVQEAWP